MVRFEPYPISGRAGNFLRIAFWIDGRKYRVVPPGGPWADTSANRKHLEKEFLKTLKALVGMAGLPGRRDEARADIMKMFPGAKSLTSSWQPQAAAGEYEFVPDLFPLVYADYQANHKKSYDSLDCRYRRPREYFKTMRIEDCTREELLKYRDVRSNEISDRTHRQMSQTTVNRELVMVHYAFKLAEERGIVKDVPRIKLFSEKFNVRKGFFEHDQYLAVLRRLPEYVRPLVMTFYATGWRTGDLMKLQRGNLRFNEGAHGILRIEDSKNNDAREFHLTAELRAELEAQVRRIDALEARTGWKIDYLWVRPDGSRMNDFRKAWTNAVRKAQEAGELKQRMLKHDFRRTTARNMLQAGVSGIDVMGSMGHRSMAMLVRYGLLNDPKAAARSSAQYAAYMQAQGMTLNGTTGGPTTNSGALQPKSSPNVGSGAGTKNKILQNRGVTSQKRAGTLDAPSETES